MFQEFKEKLCWVLMGVSTYIPWSRIPFLFKLGIAKNSENLYFNVN